MWFSKSNCRKCLKLERKCSELEAKVETLETELKTELMLSESGHLHNFTLLETYMEHIDASIVSFKVRVERCQCGKTKEIRRRF
jgi:hypothetical protein